MDAFSVSLANGLNEPNMTRKKSFGIAGTFAFFQALMPMIGWILVHTICNIFSEFEKIIPWIALILLCFIGGKMLFEGKKEEEEKITSVGILSILIQGIATSIDALSVGFTISQYNLIEALVASLIIATVTLIICLGGISIGKKFGTKLSGKANILGGLILIFIGIEIFIKGVFF
jgi:putative Mn2+ efflux pump MntP